MAVGYGGAVVREVRRLFGAGTVAGLSEWQLLRRYVAHRDEAAFSALVSRHGPMVLAVCRGLLDDPNDAEDAFQATFLVLVRRAPEIRETDSLAGWLYGVAHRVALRARSDAARRRERERRTEMAPAQDTDPDLHELRPVLHEELRKLPEKYRMPVVLCYLEGLTHEQAAEQLRWPIGTVKGRLARARDLLRTRLARRGLAVPAGAVAATLGREASAVPAALLNSTVEAAMRVAAGQATAAVLSAAVATLVEGTLRTMSMGTTLKLAAAGLVACGVIATGAGVYAYQAAATSNGQEVETPDRSSASATGPSRKPSAGPKTVATPIAETSRPTAGSRTDSDLDERIATLAQARYKRAREVLDASLADYKVGRGTVDGVRDRALKVLESRRDLSDSRANRVAAAEGYLGLLKDLKAAEKDSATTAVIDDYLLEAELWLAQAKAGKEPSRTGPGTEEGIGLDSKSRAVIAKLEMPIPMQFPEPTPLEDVLKYIKAATAGPNDEGLAVYVDPIGLQMAAGEDGGGKVTMQTPVRIDLEGVPLRVSLKYLLEQLGLGYGVRDGVLVITAPDFRKLQQGIHDLRVMEKSLPEPSPLKLLVEKAERGEMSQREVDALNERLQAIETAKKLYRSIQMGGMPGMGGMMRPPAGAGNAPAPKNLQ